MLKFDEVTITIIIVVDDHNKDKDGAENVIPKSKVNITFPRKGRKLKKKKKEKRKKKAYSSIHPFSCFLFYSVLCPFSLPERLSS